MMHCHMNVKMTLLLERGEIFALKELYGLRILCHTHTKACLTSIFEG
jgi:hydrogenase maturation factor HypF (carbamoyltransferase family)